jgi:hypothetical protein
MHTIVMFTRKGIACSIVILFTTRQSCFPEKINLFFVLTIVEMHWNKDYSLRPALTVVGE